MIAKHKDVHQGKSLKRDVDFTFGAFHLWIHGHSFRSFLCLSLLLESVRNFHTRYSATAAYWSFLKPSPTSTCYFVSNTILHVCVWFN